ncbi:hypothetical protein [Spiroplasma alleghenense]|uniref:Lipoprotein n=1 Tax=Spiroplasma alleghenense TaxID=216931 RepID=A0A345Z2W3_9MOLU|nr:hypothetical protein [Spiroplasma alleghenense]AXK50942.1 hypothetical protein SALLE_v1c02660 [Spiroplasma alleghenense]
MKKLLSILATTTLVISAPLSVIACGKTRPEVNDEFDYQKLLNEFLMTATNIFNQNLQDDFSDIYFLSKSDAEDQFLEFNFEEAWESLSDSGNKEYKLPKDHPEFFKISSILKSKADIQKIRAEAQKEILQNVNYKAILKDGKNPFTSNIEVEEITLVEKYSDKDQRILGIEYNLSTVLEHLDAKQNFQISTINYKSSITIFEDIDTAEIFKQGAEKTDEIITSDKYSNSFNFFSNNGNEEAINKNISQLSNFKELFEEEIKGDIKKELDNEKIDFETNNIKFTTNKGWNCITDQTSSGGTNYYFSQKTEWANKVKKALRLGGDEIDTLANNNSLYNPADVSKELVEYLKTDTESSKYINTFNLWHRYHKAFVIKLEQKVKNKKINLKEEMNTSFQRRLIGLHGYQVGGINLVYTPNFGNQISLELPEQFIVNKQYTTFDNTQELYNEWLRVNFLFQREFLGFTQKDSSISEEDYDYTYEFKKPKEFDVEIVPGESYKLSDFFKPIYEQTFEKIKNSNLANGVDKPEDYINSLNFFHRPGYFKVNKEGYIFMFENDGNLIEINSVMTYWTESYYEFPNQGKGFLFFHTLFRDDIKVLEYGDSKTTMRIVN